MRSLLLTLLVSGCLFDGDLKHRHTAAPEPLNDGWEIATPESVGLSPAALAAIHDELLREDRHVATLGLLVVKDGKLVWETYLRSPSDRDRQHALQSVTKSVTSLLLGIVRDDLGGPSLDGTLETIFPEETADLSQEKRGITLRDLLTMTSGIAFDNDDFSLEMWVDRPKDGLRHILDKPMYAAPGERFYYRDADPQVVGYAIARLTGRPEHELGAERLFAPLGIQDYEWETGRDGASMAAHGLHLRPRDLAKLGQMVLDGGRWQGVQVVPEAWIAESTSTQLDTDARSPSGDPYGYGFYWWVVPGVGFSAWGVGGQFVLVVPDRQMVLVQIGFPNSDFHGSNLADFERLVAPLLD